MWKCRNKEEEYIVLLQFLIFIYKGCGWFSENAKGKKIKGKVIFLSLGDMKNMMEKENKGKILKKIL